MISSAYNSIIRLFFTILIFNMKNLVIKTLILCTALLTLFLASCGKNVRNAHSMPIVKRKPASAIPTGLCSTVTVSNRVQTVTSALTPIAIAMTRF